MTQPIHIVGAGIGGLACALASVRAGFSVRVSERALSASPVGAGIQLGPNATRVLSGLGVLNAILNVATSPINMVARSIFSMKMIAQMPLVAPGGVAERYGSPYLCVHRAELHQVLVDAAVRAGVRIDWGADWTTDHVNLAEHLIAADGLWSGVRAKCGDDSTPRTTGHWAWRAMLPLEAMPTELQHTAVTAWLGKSQHIVTYPVSLGRQSLLNVVAFTPMRGSVVDGAAGRSWAVATNAPALLRELGRVHPVLTQAIASATTVTRWEVAARTPLRGPADMLVQLHGKGVALIGDAAHPMRPYMAQGAAMALEDAVTLAACMGEDCDNTQMAFNRYARLRWARNARVQRKANRNGVIFHLPAPLSWARDAALAVRPQLMDVPWLFGHVTP